MNSKEKRKNIRIPLLSEHVEINSIPEFVMNITTSGAFIKTKNLKKPREVIDIIITLPGDLGNMKVQGIVRRVVWTAKPEDAIGYGVEFVNMISSTQKIMDAYVVYLRNKQIITVSKRIIEEFFGDRPRM